MPDTPKAEIWEDERTPSCELLSDASDVAVRPLMAVVLKTPIWVVLNAAIWVSARAVAWFLV